MGREGKGRGKGKGKGKGRGQDPPTPLRCYPGELDATLLPFYCAGDFAVHQKLFSAALVI